jgi:hypothetical protein
MLQAQSVHVKVKDRRSAHHMDGVNVVGHESDARPRDDVNFVDLRDRAASGNAPVVLATVEPVQLLPTDADHDRPSGMVVRCTVLPRMRNVDVKRESVIPILRETIKTVLCSRTWDGQRKVVKRKKIFLLRKFA